jgi:hypothetical protein
MPVTLGHLPRRPLGREGKSFPVDRTFDGGFKAVTQHLDE